jgi:hypothetical protein
MPRDRLNLEHVTSPPRKKSRTIFGSSVNDLEEDEEQTYLDEIRGRGEKNLMQQPRKATLRKNLNPT